MDDFPILIVDRSHHLRLVRQAGEAGPWVQTDLASGVFWPAWQPGGEAIAVSAADYGEEGARAVIRLLDASGRITSTVFRTPTPAVISARVPHYFLWSPGGEALSYVSPTNEGLALFVFRPGEPGGEQQTLAVGAPIFQTWAPDGRKLVAHIGSGLAEFGPPGMGTRRPLGDNAVGFRCAAFSGDGEWLAFARHAEGEVDIYVEQTNAPGMSRRLARLPGGVALVFRPGTARLNVALTRKPDTGMFDELWEMDPLGEQATRLVLRGPFVSHLWSPGGELFMTVMPTQSGDGRYQLRAYSPDGQLVATAEPVVLSEDLRVYMGFFDQYAQSHSLWAPDGSAFLIAGRVPGDAVSGAFGDPVGNVVFRWQPGRGQPLEPVAPGDLGFYPPPMRPARP